MLKLVNQLCVIGVLATFFGYGCSQPDMPATPLTNPLLDFDGAWTGSPNAQSQGIAIAVKAALTKDEMAHLLLIDWATIGADGMLADPVVLKAINSIPPAVLEPLATRSLRAKSLTPKACVIDQLTCATCRDGLTQALTDVSNKFAGQVKGGAAICILSGPAAEAVCPIVVAYLLYKVTAIADMLFNCSAPVGSKLTIKSTALEELVGNVKSQLNMCIPMPDMTVSCGDGMTGCATGATCMKCGTADAICVAIPNTRCCGNSIILSDQLCCADGQTYCEPYTVCLDNCGGKSRCAAPGVTCCADGTVCPSSAVCLDNCGGRSSCVSPGTICCADGQTSCSPPLICIDNCGGKSICTTSGSTCL